MLNQSTVQIASNLAMIAKDRRVAIRAMPNTLMSELTSSVMNNYLTKISGRNLSEEISSEQGIVNDTIVSSAEGTYVYERDDVKKYAASIHDTLMDNYIDTLSKLISQYVVYARSVVYKEMNQFVEHLQADTRNTSPVQPEDLFQVQYLTKHAIFEMGLLDSEVNYLKTAAVITEPLLNVRDNILAANIDFCEKFCKLSTGENDLIKSWLTTIGDNKVKQYLSLTSTQAINVLPSRELADYHLFNFLLFKTMVEDPSLSVQAQLTMTLTQVNMLASTARDHHAQQLSLALSSRETMVRLKNVIGPDSIGQYSYLSQKPMDVYLLEENFQLAAEQGIKLEHIFGYIAKYGMVAVDVDTLVRKADELLSAWDTQRSIYTAYVTQNKSTRVKTAMKDAVRSIMSSDSHQESMKEFYAANPTFKETSITKAEKLIDSLSQTAIEDLNACSLEVIAGVIHRHSNAKEIISKMFELMNKEDGLEANKAVSVSIALYLTDFLLAQLQLS